MAQIQLIKRRIKSVANTKQITKAMELVAASKMRKAIESTLQSRAYSTSAKEVLARLNRLLPARSYPLFMKREVKNRLIILITSDRGLAGAYNANVMRLLLDELRQAKDYDIATKVIVVGAKGSHFVSRLENVELIGSYTGWPTDPKVADVRPITQTAIRLFTAGKVDSVQIIYTNFRSMARQEVLSETLLPASVPAADAQPADEETLFEPSPEAVLEAIVPRLIEAQFYQAVLEAIASEQSMRMMAMKNASDNASDLVDDLTLELNGARQASITQQLAEISAGAEAIT